MEFLNASSCMSQVLIAKYPVLETTPSALAQTIYQRMERNEPTLLFYANTNFIVQCAPIRERLSNQKVVIVNDGVGMDIAKKMLYGSKFASNLNGTDFTPYLLQHAPRPMRVFLLGARPEVVKKAAAYVEQVLLQTVAGYADGYDGLANVPQVIEKINGSKPDLLLVAMGNPKQEQWLLDHQPLLHVPVMSGVGALFDFWSGNKSRAPLWIQKIRMEWFYRLCLEPGRLLKRYSVDVLRFLIHCLRNR
jgi:beta-1,4-glucosyltransferase